MKSIQNSIMYRSFLVMLKAMLLEFYSCIHGKRAKSQSENTI